MTEIQLRSDMTVDLVSVMGGDVSVVAAARVSVVGAGAQQYEQGDANEHIGLINYLMSHRHGTPFEHAVMSFRVEAPIFVYREWHRHRVWSFNEESGRYKILAPVFHVPAADRPLTNAGSSARPVMSAGTPEQHARLAMRMEATYKACYAMYEASLEDGVAKEVAREVLPVGIYSTMYATANLRGVMSFLSLRTEDDHATYPSKPQYEIAQAARQVEAHFETKFPLVHAAWQRNGRVAP